MCATFAASQSNSIRTYSVHTIRGRRQVPPARTSTVAGHPAAISLLPFRKDHLVIRSRFQFHAGHPVDCVVAFCVAALLQAGCKLLQGGSSAVVPKLPERLV